MVARSIRSLLLIGALVGLGAALAVPAFATGATRTAINPSNPDPGYFPATPIFETPCDGDSSSLAQLDEPRGEPFDFVYGGRLGSVASISE